MGEISELLPPLPKPARFDYDHGADMGTPVYSEAQMRKYALDTVRRADARQAPTDYSNLLSVITDIRERSGVGSKPMLSELADAIAERIAEPKVGDEIQFCPQCGWNSAMDATPVPLPAGTVTEEMVDYIWAGLNASEKNMMHRNTVRRVAEAAFADRPAAEPMGVKVKPLIWHKAPNRKDWFAGSIVGRYDVGKVGASYSAILRREDADDGSIDVTVGRAATAAKARTAAQAEYDRRIRSALATPPVPDSVVEALPRYRHKKRGTEYVLIGIGRMQAEKWFLHSYTDADGTEVDEPQQSVDMREVAVYRSATDPTEIWVHPLEEFEDGRFEVLSSITETGGAK